MAPRSLFSHATGFQTRDEIGGRVVSFNGDDCDFSEVAWIGSLNLETECNKILPWIRMLFSVTCSDLPCFFFVRQPYVSIEPKQHDATVFEDVD